MAVDLRQLGEAVETGKHLEAAKLTEEGLATGIEPEALLDAMVGAMDRLGEKFKKNEVFVPEMLIAARAMKQAMAILEPKLIESGVKPVATAVIGTVQGDLHDIGKNLVAMMWKGANFNVIDLGTNVSAERFLAAAKEHNPQIIGLSALLTTTMPAMKSTVQAIKAAQLSGVKVVIGGAPVTDAFASEIGADGFAPDAASAVDTARSLIDTAA